MAPLLRSRAVVAVLLASAACACSSTDTMGEGDGAGGSATTAGAGGATSSAGAAGAVSAGGSSSAGHAGSAGAQASGGKPGSGGAAGQSGGKAGNAGAGGGAGGSVGGHAAAGAGGQPSGGGAGGVAEGGKSGDAGAGGASSGSAGAGGEGGAAPQARVVAYLPNYSGSYADWANKIDFTRMTHLNLAFATANGNDEWDLGASDGEVKALVDAAHAHGTKVLASLGGGGGDQTVIARYKDEANIPSLIDHLEQLVDAHGLDGADVDIEDPGNLGKAYSAFVDQMVERLRPKGKLVTAAVAQYLQGSMSDDTLHQFDFVNVMVYSSFDDGVSALTFYAKDKAVPTDKLTLGAGFFGSDADGNEYAYADILKADSQAWDKDQASVGGKTVHYTGMATMKSIAQYSKGFGGIMFWELSQDVSGSHSLYKVIKDTMAP